MYLQRRLQFLLKSVESGKVKISSEFAETDEGKLLIADLEKIEVANDGSIILDSSSFRVRSLAKFVYSMDRFDVPEKEQEERLGQVSITPDELIEINRKYFMLLDNLFTAGMGKPYSEFHSEEDFIAANRADTDTQRQRGQAWLQALEKYEPLIRQHHIQHNRIYYASGDVVGGLRTVMGGSSRFPPAAIDGLRKFALYADTIFVPDPIVPWLEVDRLEERFPIVELLRQLYFLLQVKPLADADVPYPAVIVFPSWEKSLEHHDAETQDQISEMSLQFFSHYLDARFDDESEIVQHVTGSGSEEFRKAVDQYELFWPPGEDNPLSFDQGLKKYKDQLEAVRSDEWLEVMGSLPPEALMVNGILERLSPIFHIRENASVFRAQPLFWLPAHYHYFQLNAQAGNNQLEEKGLVQADTFATLHSLQQPSSSWLGNISMTDLAKFREENLNDDFRRELAEHLDKLSESDYENLSNVAAEVGRGISSLIARHSKEAQAIGEKYDREHMRSAATSALSLGAVLFPELAPYTTVTIGVSLIKTLGDLYSQRRDEKLLARSLTGILSTAKHRKE